MFFADRSVQTAYLLDCFHRTQSLKKFEVLGGVVAGTEESRGTISLDRPNRQWDYPCVIPLQAVFYLALTIPVGFFCIAMHGMFQFHTHGMMLH
jgi:hypothetical protein